MTTIKRQVFVIWFLFDALYVLILRVFKELSYQPALLFKETHKLNQVQLVDIELKINITFVLFEGKKLHNYCNIFEDTDSKLFLIRHVLLMKIKKGVHCLLSIK